MQKKLADTVPFSKWMNSSHMCCHATNYVLPKPAQIEGGSIQVYENINICCCIYGIKNSVKLIYETMPLLKAKHYANRTI